LGVIIVCGEEIVKETQDVRGFSVLRVVYQKKNSHEKSFKIHATLLCTNLQKNPKRSNLQQQKRKNT